MGSSSAKGQRTPGGKKDPPPPPPPPATDDEAAPAAEDPPPPPPAAGGAAAPPAADKRPSPPPSVTSTVEASTTAVSDEAADEPAFDIEGLRAEVEALRSDLPPYVTCLGSLSVPTILCDDEGQLSKPRGDGPWDLTASVRGGEGDDSDAEALKETAAEAAAAAAMDAWLDAESKSEAAEVEMMRAAKHLESLRDTRRPPDGHWCLTPSVGTWLCRFNYGTEWEGKQDAEVFAAREVDAARAKSAAAAEDALKEAKFRLSKARTLEHELKATAKKAERAKAKAQFVAAYNFPFRIGMRFDREWPKSPPTVRFRCVMHHALVDDNGSMLLPFYRTMPKDPKRGACTLRLVLEAVHAFLVDPLAAWGIPAEAAPQRLVQSLQANRVENEQRLSTIRQYALRVKHKELFEEPARWREEWFEPSFWRAQGENTPEAWRGILTEHMPGEIFSFKVFTDAFCELLLEEIFNFYATGLPARRPNSMNNYGIILNEIGLEPMIDELQRMLQPLGELLFPGGAGSGWDGHHCFIVRYRKGEDLGLDMHTDDSDVTFNICLGLDFTGSLLRFCGIMGAGDHRKHTYTYSHEKGAAVVHLGRRRHGAEDLATGERMSLILWNHSSTYRSSDEYTEPPYTTEEGPPDEICVSYTHDRDYGIFKEYPVGKENFKGRGWCPPARYEYDNFKADAERQVGG